MPTPTNPSKGPFTRPVTGSLEELFGMLRRPGVPLRSLEDIDEGIAALARNEDERVRLGQA